MALAVSFDVDALYGLPLYHGTQAHEFDDPNCPFWVTPNRDRAERFSISHRALGPRRILQYKLIRQPDLFVYHSEVALDEAVGIVNCGVGLCQSERHALLAEVFTKQKKYDGWVIPNAYGDGGHDVAVFDPRFLKLVDTEYLDADSF